MGRVSSAHTLVGREPSGVWGINAEGGKEDIPHLEDHRSRKGKHSTSHCRHELFTSLRGFPCVG